MGSSWDVLLGASLSLQKEVVTDRTMITFSGGQVCLVSGQRERHLTIHAVAPSSSCSTHSIVNIQARAGVDLGPSALIKYGLLDQVRHLGWQASYDPAASFTSDNPYNPLPKSDAPKGGEKTLVREDPTSPADPDRTRGTEDEAAAPKVLEYVQRLPDPPIGNMKKPRLVSSVCEKLSGVVKGYAERGVMPVTLGGDHSLVRLRRLVLPTRVRA